MALSKKKRVLLGITVTFVIGYVALQLAEDKLKAWYADNYMHRETPAIAKETPDQVALTLARDPRTAVAAQWRTAPSVAEGVVQLRKVGAPETEAREIEAEYVDLFDHMITNDPENRRFFTMLPDLAPGTKYVYRAGSEENGWSGWTEFSTAPEGKAPFSFVYLGDPQEGLGFWGELIHKCYSNHPNAAFYLIAGDLVNRGKYRDEWDEFFAAGQGIFDRRPIVPVLGNHDYSSRPNPDIYLKLFTLPDNGPTGFYSERAYKFTYGDVLFIILDANLHPNTQGPWLEKTLRESTETWKIVSFHQPAYSSKSSRDNPEVRRVWGRIFDKYHVDLALQGHDHAYMRTQPMHNEQPVESFAEGTVYVISVSGTKYYDIEPRDYAVIMRENLSTYQVIDIDTTPEDRLTYRAYDFDGNVIDEFVIVK